MNTNMLTIHPEHEPHGMMFMKAKNLSHLTLLLFPVPEIHLAGFLLAYLYSACDHDHSAR